MTPAGVPGSGFRLIIQVLVEQASADANTLKASGWFWL